MLCSERNLLCARGLSEYVCEMDKTGGSKWCKTWLWYESTLRNKLRSAWVHSSWNNRLVEQKPPGCIVVKIHRRRDVGYVKIGILLSTKIISSLLLNFKVRLLVVAYAVILWSSADIVSTLAADTMKYVSSAYLQRWLSLWMEWRSPALAT